MSEMVDIVVRGIERQFAFEYPMEWKRRLARAAIAAMREPTEGMLDAFYVEPCWGDGPEAADTWRAMIDEALKDE